MFYNTFAILKKQTFAQYFAIEKRLVYMKIKKKIVNTNKYCLIKRKKFQKKLVKKLPCKIFCNKCHLILEY